MINKVPSNLFIVLFLTYFSWPVIIKRPNQNKSTFFAYKLKLSVKASGLISNQVLDCFTVGMFSCFFLLWSVVSPIESNAAATLTLENGSVPTFDDLWLNELMLFRYQQSSHGLLMHRMWGQVKTYITID